MNCTEMRELLILEADGGLESAEVATLVRHLMSCRECRIERARVSGEWAELREVAGRFRASGVIPPANSPNQLFGKAMPGKPLPSSARPKRGGPGAGARSGASLGRHNDHGSGRTNSQFARRCALPVIAKSASPESASAQRDPARPRRLMRAGPLAATILATTIGLMVGAAAWLVMHETPPQLIASAPGAVRIAATGLVLQSGDSLPVGEVIALVAADDVGIRVGARGVQFRGDGAVRFAAQGIEVLSGKLRVAADGDLVLHVPGATLKPELGGADLEILVVPTSGRSDALGEIHVVRGHVDVVSARDGATTHLGADQRWQLAGHADDGAESRHDVSGDRDTQDATSHRQRSMPEGETRVEPRDFKAPADSQSLGPVLVLVVRDQLTNLPVPGVALELTDVYNRSSGAADDRAENPPRRAWSDSQGWAVVHDLPAGDYRLIAEGPLGYRGSVLQAVLFRGEPTVVEVVLNPAIAIGGRLLDEAGAPVADVAIGNARTDHDGKFTIELNHGEWQDLAVGDADAGDAFVGVRATWANTWEAQARRVMSNYLTAKRWWLVLDQAVGFTVEVDVHSGRKLPSTRTRD